MCQFYAEYPDGLMSAQSLADGIKRLYKLHKSPEAELSHKLAISLASAINNVNMDYAKSNLAYGHINIKYSSSPDDEAEMVSLALISCSRGQAFEFKLTSETGIDIRFARDDAA